LTPTRPPGLASSSESPPRWPDMGGEVRGGSLLPLAHFPPTVVHSPSTTQGRLHCAAAEARGPPRTQGAAGAARGQGRETRGRAGDHPNHEAESRTPAARTMLPEETHDIRCVSSFRGSPSVSRAPSTVLAPRDCSTGRATSSRWYRSHQSLASLEHHPTSVLVLWSTRDPQAHLHRSTVVAALISLVSSTGRWDRRPRRGTAHRSWSRRCWGPGP
jgi:hypothetical protein